MSTLAHVMTCFDKFFCTLQKIYTYLESHLVFGWTQVDEINFGTAIHVACIALVTLRASASAGMVLTSKARIFRLQIRRVNINTDCIFLTVLSPLTHLNNNIQIPNTDKLAVYSKIHVWNICTHFYFQQCGIQFYNIDTHTRIESQQTVEWLPHHYYNGS